MRMTDALMCTKAKVEQLLSSNADLRDSDKKLWLAYLNEFHGLKDSLGNSAYTHFYNILMSENVPTMESVRRVRQKLQEEGKYVGQKRLNRMAESVCVRAWAIEK